MESGRAKLDREPQGSGLRSDRWEVEVEMGMNRRKLVEDPFGVGATRPHFPTFGYKMSSWPQKLPLGIKMCGCL